jgi:hypothetical protein
VLVYKGGTLYQASLMLAQRRRGDPVSREHTASPAIGPAVQCPCWEVSHAIGMESVAGDVVMGGLSPIAWNR